MPYRPGKLPSLTDPDAIALAQYFEDELLTLSRGLIENVTEVALSPIFAAPKKPREGMVVYADGTLWNPGSGEGLYVYSSGGTWIWLEDNPVIPSVPSFPLSIANGGTADSGTAWASYAVTVSTGTGTATAVGHWKSIGKTIFLSVVVTFTSAVTGTVSLNLPIASIRQQILSGEDVAVNGHPHVLRLVASSTTASLVDVNTSAFPTTNGLVIPITGVYESV